MGKQRLIFVGTYTEPILFGSGKILKGKGKGIHVYRFDADLGTMSEERIMDARPNPSYLVTDPSCRFLYAVNELKEFEGAPTGAISAFSMDADSGELQFLNRKPTHGTDPCHVTVHQSGRYVLVANFMSGSVCVLPICEDGSLGDATDVIQHHGSSVDPARQAGPHAHAVVLDKTGSHVFIPDLGLDKVMIYRFDKRHGQLRPHDPPWIEGTPGSGPRQLVLHPSARYAYLINELDSTMTAFQYNEEKATLREIQTVPTLPEGFQGTNTCAEIQISPSGEFLYGSNRGHNSIVTYAIRPSDGTLVYVGHQSTRGSTPRHFAVDPGGDFVLVANQDSDNIVVFAIDLATGELVPTAHGVQVPTPVCVRIV
jgi:6-phosphogluconolactonase